MRSARPAPSEARRVIGTRLDLNAGSAGVSSAHMLGSGVGDGRGVSLLLGTTEYATGENMPAIFYLLAFLLIVAVSLYFVYRTIRWLFGPTVLDSQYTSRPPQLTHRCLPPRNRRTGARWVCSTCGCPWLASRGGTTVVPVTVEVGPGPPGTKRLETQYRQAPGGLHWFFDRETYEA